jgi:hypothetical protein
MKKKLRFEIKPLTAFLMWLTGAIFALVTVASVHDELMQKSPFTLGLLWFFWFVFMVVSATTIKRN